MDAIAVSAFEIVDLKRDDWVDIYLFTKIAEINGLLSHMLLIKIFYYNINILTYTTNTANINPYTSTRDNSGSHGMYDDVIGYLYGIRQLDGGI